MNSFPKPKLIEFMFRGIPARNAVDIRARWEMLTEADLRELGFIEDAPLSVPTVGQSTLH